MAATVLDNAIVRNPAVRILVEFAATEGVKLPVRLPVRLTGLTAMRFSTEDVYADGAFWERRVVGKPTMTLRSLNAFGGTSGVDSVTLDLANHDGLFNSFFTSESRKRTVRVHLYDKTRDVLQRDFFVGQVAGFRQTLRAFSIALTALDLAEMGDEIPITTTQLSKFATAKDGGTVWTLGSGVALHVPCRNVKRRMIDSDPEEYDYIVMSGNAGIDRVYRGGGLITVPEETVTENFSSYVVLHRVYVDEVGRYATVLRFDNRQANTTGAGDELPIVADVQRVYPDFDDAVVAEFKWKGNFSDSADPPNPTTPGGGGGPGDPPPDGDPGGGGGNTLPSSFAVTTQMACVFDMTYTGGGGPPPDPPPASAGSFHYYHYLTTTGDEAWYPAGLVRGLPTSITGTVGWTANRLYAVPFLLARTRTIGKLGLYVTAAAVGGTRGRLALYKSVSDANLYPGSLIVDASIASGAEFDPSSVATPMKEQQVDTVCTPGIYWLTFSHNATTTAPGLRGFAAAGGAFFWGFTGYATPATTAPPGLNALYVSNSHPAAGVSLPSSFPGGATMVDSVTVRPFFAYTVIA